MPRVLFVNSNINDYLADGVFHGLRTLLGADALDFPKAEYLYQSFPRRELQALWGHGFTLYGLLEDLELTRHHVIERALEREFDLVVFGDIWRSFGLWSEWGPRLHDAGVPMAVLDGHDAPRPYPYSRRWWRRRYWWLLPRAHTRARYFKREVTWMTRWCASYMLVPPGLGRTLGIQPIAFSIPPEKIVSAPPPKDRDFPAHIVDAELASRMRASPNHVFDDEAGYYADLQRSRFGVTTKRAGWEAMRHYEIAANGAVPCFRDLARKPAGCAPFGLNAGNSIAYGSARDLMDRVASLSEDEYLRLQAGALAWARANTTVERARQLLRAFGLEPAP